MQRAAGGHELLGGVEEGVVPVPGLLEDGVVLDPGLGVVRLTNSGLAPAAGGS